MKKLDGKRKLKKLNQNKIHLKEIVYYVLP